MVCLSCETPQWAPRQETPSCCTAQEPASLHVQFLYKRVIGKWGDYVNGGPPLTTTASTSTHGTVKV